MSILRRASTGPCPDRRCAPGRVKLPPRRRAEPAFVETFGGKFSEGDHQLKRVPAGFPADHPAADILRQKDLTFGRLLSDEEALSPDLPDILAHHLAVAVPMLRYLAGAPVEVATPVPA